MSVKTYMVVAVDANLDCFIPEQFKNNAKVSKKDGQRIATELVRVGACIRAEVVETVLSVSKNNS